MSLDPVRRLVLASAAILAACSSDSPTNPGGGNPQPGPLTGTWVASFGMLSGGGAFCWFPSLSMTATETGSSLAGTYEGYGKGMCAVSTGIYSGGTLPGTLTGNVTDSVVHIDLSIPNFHLIAVARTDSLVGTLTRSITLAGNPSGPYTVTGTWRASLLPTNLQTGDAAFIQVQPDLLIIPLADSLLPTITVRDKDRQGIAVQPPVTLSISDTTVATITPGGWIKGKLKTAVFALTARSGAAYADAVGAVLPAPHSMVITPGAAAINRTHTVQLDVRVLDYFGNDLSGVPVSYTSSNSAIATVSSSGLVTSKGPLGQVAIRAHSGTVTDSILVSVVAIPVNLGIDPPTAVLSPGDSLRVPAAAWDSAGIAIDSSLISYHSDNQSVISVSGAGMAKAVGPAGFATITATLDTFVRTMRILSRSGPLPAVVATSAIGTDDYGLAVSAAGAMYVGGLEYFGVARGDLPSLDFPTVLPLIGPFLSIAFNPSGTRACLCRAQFGQILVVDVASNQVIDSIPADSTGDRVAVAVTPDGQKLLVGTINYTTVYDANSLALLATIRTGFTNQFSFHPTQALVYANADSITEINLNTLAPTRGFRLPAESGRPMATAVSADGSELYVAADLQGLKVFDLATGSIKDFTEQGNGFDLAVSPGQELIYLTEPTYGIVALIDRRSRVPIAQLHVGGVPRRVVLDASGTTAVVVNQAGWVDFIK
jgi:hypothetical protein